MKWICTAVCFNTQGSGIFSLYSPVNPFLEPPKNCPPLIPSNLSPKKGGCSLKGADWLPADYIPGSCFLYECWSGNLLMFFCCGRSGNEPSVFGCLHGVDGWCPASFITIGCSWLANFCLGLENICRQQYETDELPNPTPTPTQKKRTRQKVAFGPLFPTANNFTWVGIGFM